MSAYKTEDLDITLIKVSSQNVRKDVNEINGNQETSIQDLANSIKEKGLLNPITVRSCFDGTYEVFAGQRRLSAVKSLGHPTIRCTIVPDDTSDLDMQTMSLVENFQRQDNSYKDKVEAFAALLVNHCNGNINKLCQIVGVTELTARKYVKMQHLPAEVLQCLDANNEGKRLTLAAALRLVELTKEQQMVAGPMLVGKSVEEASHAIQYLKMNPSFSSPEAITSAVKNAILNHQENHLVENQRLMEQSWRARHPWIHDPRNEEAVFKIRNIEEAFRLLNAQGLLSYVQDGSVNYLARKRHLDNDFDEEYTDEVQPEARDAKRQHATPVKTPVKREVVIIE